MGKYVWHWASCWSDRLCAANRPDSIRASQRAVCGGALAGAVLVGHLFSSGSLPVRAVMGLFVLVPAWVGLNHLRTGGFQFGDSSNNLLLILYVFCVVWVADIGAYFAGRAFGKAKLAPRVSPGKSWAGVWGGLVAVGAFALVVSFLASAGAGQTLLLIVASLATGLVSVLGDLLESMLKRHRGIKDSSQLLPGHGGIMDRIDSLTAAIPVFALIITQLGWLTTGHW